MTIPHHLKKVFDVPDGVRYAGKRFGIASVDRSVLDWIASFANCRVFGPMTPALTYRHRLRATMSTTVLTRVVQHTHLAQSLMNQIHMYPMTTEKTIPHTRMTALVSSRSPNSL